MVSLFFSLLTVVFSSFVFVKVDEDLLKSCGKMMVLDKMLTELRRRGHKVSLTICYNMNDDKYRSIKKWMTSLNIEQILMKMEKGTV
jgi:hypothetical protein